MIRKRTLLAELAGTRAQLKEVTTQRDMLLERAFDKGDAPPGTWGPFGRYVVLRRRRGDVHLVPGDTFTVEP